MANELAGAVDLRTVDQHAALLPVFKGETTNAAVLFKLAAQAEQPGSPAMQRPRLTGAERSQNRQKLDRFEQVRLALAITADQQIEPRSEADLLLGIVAKVFEKETAENAHEHHLENHAPDPGPLGETTMAEGSGASVAHGHDDVEEAFVTQQGRPA